MWAKGVVEDRHQKLPNRGSQNEAGVRGCHSRKISKNVDAIWRIFVIFGDCQVRLTIDDLVLKIIFFSPYKHNQNKT